MEHGNYFGPVKLKDENLSLLGLFLAVTPGLDIDVIKPFDQK